MDTKIPQATEDAQKQRHNGLHVSLDKASAKYLITHPGSMLGGTMVSQLLEWLETADQDLFVPLVILSAQFMSEHRGTNPDHTSLLALIVWSGRRDYKGN